MHDPLAAAAVIDESTCDYEQHWIDVETEGELTAGQVVVDRRPYSDDARKAGRTVRCAIRADRQRMLELLFNRALA